MRSRGRCSFRDASTPFWITPEESVVVSPEGRMRLRSLPPSLYIPITRYALLPLMPCFPLLTSSRLLSFTIVAITIRALRDLPAARSPRICRTLRQTYTRFAPRKFLLHQRGLIVFEILLPKVLHLFETAVQLLVRFASRCVFTRHSLVDTHVAVGRLRRDRNDRSRVKGYWYKGAYVAARCRIVVDPIHWTTLRLNQSLEPSDTSILCLDVFSLSDTRHTRSCIRSLPYYS